MPGAELSRPCDRRGRIHGASDAPLHSKDEAWHVSCDRLSQSGSKLVHQVHACIVADRRTDVSDRVRVRTCPVGTRSIVRRHRRQHSHNVGCVHAPPPRFIARHEDPGRCVRGSPQQTVLRRCLVPRRLGFRERRVQILPQERSRLALCTWGLKHESGSGGQRGCGTNPNRTCSQHQVLAGGDSVLLCGHCEGRCIGECALDALAERSASSQQESKKGRDCNSSYHHSHRFDHKLVRQKPRPAPLSRLPIMI